MFSPSEIYNNYKQTAKAKTTNKWYKILVLAILAGAFIAFGAVGATMASSGFSGSAASLIKGVVFPVGLILVVVCGAELFTGNCLLVSPAITKDISVGGLFKNWGIVYLGNLVGGVLIALLVVFGHVQGEAAANACVSVAAAKCNMGFGDAFVRGILCNMLVCLAVWASMSCKTTTGKILAVFMPIMVFVVCGFEHSVANMYYLSAGLLASAEYAITAGGLTIGRALLYCLLPTTLGNIVGGGFIALCYHVAYGKFEKKSKNQDAKQDDAK